MEEGTAPRCRCVMHGGGLGAPSIAVPSPPPPLPWDLLQPSSSFSSSWHLLPPPGLPPALGPHKPTASVCYICRVYPFSATHPLLWQLSSLWTKNKSLFPNVLATFLVSFFSPCPFSCPDPPSPVPHFLALCCLLPHAHLCHSAAPPPPPTCSSLFAPQYPTPGLMLAP